MSATEPTHLDELRTRATDLIREHDWPGLAALEADLRTDLQYWASFWGPACAAGAWHQSRPDARDLLEECIRDGFHQPDLLGEVFSESFGTDPDGAELRARIEANAPPPAVELVRWPCVRPILPLGLFRLDASGEARLAARLPAPQPSAWATAQTMLAWVTNRWRHTTTSHDGSGDANVVLDRVDRGDRFACKEFTIVLTQALNAVRIPALRVGLFQANYHSAIGSGHAVTEAWIDDLGKWVLLDGQNGAVWRDAAGTPLSVLELQQQYRAGDRPQFDGTGHNFSPGDAGTWFTFFDTVWLTGQLAWSPGSFIPVAEGTFVTRCARLAASDTDAAPDLSAVSTGVTDDGGVALTFGCDHPYAAGVLVTGHAGETAELAGGQPLRLASTPGEHTLSVAARTPYGTLTAHPLRYIIRQPAGTHAAARG
jgi:hypothetical protein